VRNETGRIGDGRGEHSELDKERDGVADVTISIERREPQAEDKDCEDGESEKPEEAAGRPVLNGGRGAGGR
jgi:hypothetical protein